MSGEVIRFLAQWPKMYKLHEPRTYLPCHLLPKMPMILVFSLGALSHITWFTHGMLDLCVLACALLVNTLVFWLLQGQTFTISLYISATIEIQFLACLFLSIAAYRLSHPWTAPTLGTIELAHQQIDSCLE
jgi:hypothetical protein